MPNGPAQDSLETPSKSCPSVLRPAHANPDLTCTARHVVGHEHRTIQHRQAKEPGAPKKPDSVATILSCMRDWSTWRARVRGPTNGTLLAKTPTSLRRALTTLSGLQMVRTSGVMSQTASRPACSSYRQFDVVTSRKSHTLHPSHTYNCHA